jgi:hypothetical protein
MNYEEWEVLYFKIYINVTPNFMKRANLSYQIIIQTKSTHFLLKNFYCNKILQIYCLFQLLIQKLTSRSRNILGRGSW